MMLSFHGHVNLTLDLKSINWALLFSLIPKYVWSKLKICLRTNLLSSLAFRKFRSLPEMLSWLSCSFNPFLFFKLVEILCSLLLWFNDFVVDGKRYFCSDLLPTLWLIDTEELFFNFLSASKVFKAIWG